MNQFGLDEFARRNGTKRSSRPTGDGTGLGERIAAAEAAIDARNSAENNDENDDNIIIYKKRNTNILDD